MCAARHAIALFLATLGVVCTHPVAAEALASPVIRIGVASAPKNLDPATATDAASARLLQLTHPALLTYNNKLQPIGLVAQSCEQRGPLRVTCLLPKNVTFSDGTPFTADRVATWLAKLQRNPKSPLSGFLKDVFIALTDDTTLDFQLPRAMPGFLDSLVQIPIANPRNPGSGTGAYTLGQPDTLGNITLTPLNKSKPLLQFLYVSDPTTRTLKLTKGELDVLQNDLPPELVTYLKDKNFPALTVPGSSYTYVAYNFRNSDLADPRWRDALARATNRAALREQLLGGQAAPAGSLLPPGGPATWEAPEEPYEPAQVSSELDETYLPDGAGTRITLTLTTSTDPTAQRIAQVLQQQWARIGVQLTIRPTEWAALYDAVKNGRFDMVLMTWTGLQTPDFLYSVFEGSQTPPNGFNRGRVNDETLNHTLGALHNAPTPEQKTQLALQAQQYIAQLRPYLPLFRRHQVLVTAPSVEGCDLDMTGSYKGLTTCRLTPPPASH